MLATTNSEARYKNLARWRRMLHKRPAVAAHFGHSEDFKAGNKNRDATQRTSFGDGDDSLIASLLANGNHDKTRVQIGDDCVDVPRKRRHGAIGESVTG